jgi:hypothetical protein
MHKRIAIGILVFGGVITLVALSTPARPSPLRLGAKVEDAVKQIESKWTPTPDSDRPKYVPYRSFHLSCGGGTLETHMDYCFPMGRVWAARYATYVYAGDGTITNISSWWKYAVRL